MHFLEWCIRKVETNIDYFDSSSPPAGGSNSGSGVSPEVTGSGLRQNLASVASLVVSQNFYSYKEHHRS